MSCCHPTTWAHVTDLSMRPWGARAGAAALFLLAVLGGWLYLARFAYLPGTDAYFYALQAQTLLETGRLKVPDRSVVHYLVAALAWAGMPIKQALHLVLSLIFALFALTFWRLVAGLRRAVWPVAALGMLAVAPFMLYHTIEFPRLSIGLAWLPLWFRAVGEPRGWARPTFWLLLVGAALLHPLLTVLAVIVPVVVLATQWLAAGPLRWRRLRRAMLWAMAASTIVVGAVGLMWPGFFQRLTGLSVGMPGLLSLLSAPGLPLDLRATVLLCSVVLALLYVPYWGQARQRPDRLLPCLGLTMVCWPDAASGVHGLGGRLALASVYVALPISMQMLNELLPAAQQVNGNRLRMPQRIVGALAVLMLAALPTRLSSYDILLKSNEDARYERVVEALRQRDVPMLIAHRGLDFYYTFRLRRDAFHFDPEPEWNKTEIWRVAMGLTPEEIAYYSPARCPWGETSSLIPGTPWILVREDCWEQFRANVDPNTNPDLYLVLWQNMENPSQPRPGFLRERLRRATQ